MREILPFALDHLGTARSCAGGFRIIKMPHRVSGKRQNMRSLLRRSQLLAQLELAAGMNGKRGLGS